MKPTQIETLQAAIRKAIEAVPADCRDGNIDTQAAVTAAERAVNQFFKKGETEMNTKPKPKPKPRIVRLYTIPRLATGAVLPPPGLKFFVEQENEMLIHLDNRVKGEFHCAVTLLKIPNGRLANAVGQEFEMEEEV
jgi:hypothetical protein